MQRRRREILATVDGDARLLADAADAVRDAGRVVVVLDEKALAEYHADAVRPRFDEVLRPLAVTA